MHSACVSADLGNVVVAQIILPTSSRCWGYDMVAAPSGGADGDVQRIDAVADIVDVSTLRLLISCVMVSEQVSMQTLTRGREFV